MERGEREERGGLVVEGRGGRQREERRGEPRIWVFSQ